MKKFLGIIILVTAMQFAKSQCTAFLGPDKQFMPCSNPFVLNPNLIFNEPASTTFQQEQLPAFDTIFGAGGAIDTLIPLTTKVMYTATRANGCADVCIVGVAIRTWPIPNLGLDTTLYLSIQQETTNIFSIFNPIVLSTSGYNNHTWSTVTPQDVDTGFYSVTVVTHDGCSDVLNIAVKCAVKKDTVVQKCEGNDRYDLTTLFVKSGYSNLWKRIRFPQGDTVIYATPAAADTGRYLLFSSKPGRCTDTVFVKVENRPRLQLGPDRKVIKCFGSTADITLEFILTGLTTIWSIPDATKAPLGNHRLIATNSFGCKDTAFVEVRDTTKPYIGPDENERICPRGTFLNLANNFLLNNLSAEWNTPNPTQVSDAGRYRVIARNGFGCKDTGFFTVEHYERPAFLNDTTVKICAGKTRNLNTIFTLDADYINVDWTTATPNAVGEGVYTGTFRNSFTDCVYDVEVTVEVVPNTPPNLNLCVFNTTTNASVFTTNFFRTVTIDKLGNTWAGTENGGLYKFEPLVGTACGGVWKKNIPVSGISAAINRYKDLQVSPVPGDNSIWAASQGHDHPKDITGGIDRILNLNSAIQHWGSVNVPMSTELGSRNVNSLTIGNSGKIYAALSQSITNDSSGSIILEGGIYHNTTTNPATDFTKFLGGQPLADIRITASGKRGNKIWFGVNKSCNPSSGGCINPYILEMNDPSMLITNNYNETNTPLPFTNQGLIVTAIFTAKDGRTYVGLNDSLGIGVAMPDNGVNAAEWTLVNTTNSPLPYNARINFNAITEVDGEIWFGTNFGLMVYDGIGPLTECSSYKFYTTAQGLPGNNVTDIAFDSTNYNLWITTANGIAKVATNHEISGTVFNASCGKYTALRSNIRRVPLKDVTVYLFEKRTNLPDIIVDSKLTDSTGKFNFINVTPLKNYYVDVRYKNSSYRYRYNNVKSNTIIGDVLIPDSLMVEMQELMDLVPTYSLNMDIYGYPLVVGSADGFDTATHKSPFNFYQNNVIENNHFKRVENIANYYMAMATVYKMALNYTDLRGEQFAAFLDGCHSILAFAKHGSEFSSRNNDGTLDKVLRNCIKTLMLTVKTELNLLVETLEEPKKSSIKAYMPYVNSIFDGTANLINNGAKGTLFNELVENAKKILLLLPLKLSHELFCRFEHKDLIQNLATQSTNLLSSKKYSLTYPIVFSTANPIPPAVASYNKQNNDLYEEKKETISLQKTAAKFADAAAGTFDAIEQYAVIKQIKIAMKVFAALSKTLNTGLLFKSASDAFDGANEIQRLSHFVTPATGFQEGTLAAEGAENITSVVLDSLRARRTRFVNALSGLKVLYNNTYDSASFFNNINAYVNVDSLFKEEIENVNNMLEPKIKDGVSSVNNFVPRFNMTVDSFMQKLLLTDANFGAQNYEWYLTPDSAALKTSLINTADNMKMLADSMVNAYEDLLGRVSNIASPAYLVQTNCQLNFNYQPGGNGTVTYTLKNIGTIPKTNVSVLISQPTGGFNITSPSLVNLGNFAPGQSKQISYTFSAPDIDTIGDYSIQTFADNGLHKNINGVFITQTSEPIEVASIANGLWSNPETWSSGRVPSASSRVTILHNVDVDITTAICESIRAITPGLLKVKAGMKLSVLK